MKNQFLFTLFTTLLLAISSCSNDVIKNGDKKSDEREANHSTSKKIDSTEQPEPIVEIIEPKRRVDAIFTPEFILAIQSDLAKVSGVMDDIENFEPLEKHIDIKAYKGTSRLLQKFDQVGNIPTQYSYSYKVVEGKYILTLVKVDLEQALIVETKEFEFDSKPQRAMQTSEGKVFILLKNHMIYLLGNKKSLAGDDIYNNAFKLKPSNQMVCMFDKNQSRVSMLLPDRMITKNYEGVNSSSYCVGENAFIVSGTSMTKVTPYTDNQIFNLEDCMNIRKIVRNNELYISCKELEEKRYYYRYDNLSEPILLPKRNVTESSKYISKLKQVDIGENDSPMVLISKKESGLLSEVALDSEVIASRLSYFSRDDRFIFRGRKDLYYFNSEFNLVKKKVMPFLATMMADGKIFNKKFERFNINEEFDYDQYLLGGKNYLNQFKEYSPEEVVSITHTRLLRDKLVFKDAAKYFKLNFDTMEKTQLAEISNSQKAIFNNDTSVVFEYDNASSEHIFNIYKQEEELHYAITGLHKKSKFTLNSESLLAYNGKLLSFFNLETGEFSYSVELKHLKQVFNLENDRFLLVKKGITIQENDLPVETVDIVLISSDQSIGDETVGTVNVRYKDIRYLELVDNFLFLYKKDHSFIVKKVNREFLYLGN